MHGQHHISLPYRLALVIILLIGFSQPQPVHAFVDYWKDAASLTTARYTHTTTLLPDGKVLVVGGFDGFNSLSSAELYDPSTNTWKSAKSMSTPRYGHTATLLSDGTVLVAGGYDFSGGNYPTTVEVYDPVGDSWSTVDPLNAARSNPTATLLPDGEVLVVGGFDDDGPLTSSELYNPIGKSWTTVDPLNKVRSNHTATLLPDGTVLVVGGADESGNSLDSAELYDPGLVTWTPIAYSLNDARANHTATLLPDGKVLVVGGNADVSKSVEIYDPNALPADAWTTVDPQNTARSNHTATLLPNGNVLVAGGFDPTTGDSLDSTELFDPIGNTWTTVGDSLTNARADHTATLLPDGNVLVVGGTDGTDGLATTEVYRDRNAGSWSSVTSLNHIHGFHTATLLQSGKVLVAGGDASGSYLTRTEVYDPSLGTWTDVTSLNTARGYHTSTLLRNGKVLVVAGWNGSSYLKSAELYDPSLDTWTLVASLNTARYGHTATLLPNGKVLVVGGYTDNSLADVELYDPVANTWSDVAPLSSARYGHTATLLPDGKVLVAGGYDTYISDYLTAVEVYDPDLNTWTDVTPLNAARYLHTATLLPNGKVLVAGGSNGNSLASVEVYDPSLDTWTDVAPLNTARHYHKATLLPNGNVLVAGGDGGPNYHDPLSSAEVYDPSLDTWTNVDSLNTTRYGHTLTLLLNGKVLVAGGGNSSGNGTLNIAEEYDQGLGFEDAWRPVINSISAPLTIGDSFTLTGLGFRGVGFTEASGGGTNSSASNYPLVQIRRLDNEQCLWVQPGGSPFTDTSFTSSPVNGILAGPAIVTVYVNGIPSVSQPGNNHFTTMTSLVSSINPSTFGQTVTFTATVASGAGTPTGIVTFMDGITTLGTATLSGGVATFSTSALTGGAHPITAAYEGDSIFDPSVSVELVQNINKATTTTSLVSSINPSTFGQTVTFTATVASSAGTHTGLVTFKDGLVTLGTGTLSGGTATFSTALLASGTHTITAAYGGDGNYIASVSASLTQTVVRKVFLPIVLR